MFLHSYTNKDEDRLSGPSRDPQTAIIYTAFQLDEEVSTNYSVYSFSFQYFYRLIPFCFIFFLFYMSFARVKVSGLSLVFNPTSHVMRTYLLKGPCPTTNS